MGLSRRTTAVSIYSFTFTNVIDDIDTLPVGTRVRFTEQPSRSRPGRFEAIAVTLA